jgi:uncharacterized membrane protein YjjB (DUF3815 family)
VEHGWWRMLSFLELIVDFFVTPRQTIAFLVIACGALTVFFWTMQYGETIAAILAALYIVVVGGFIEYRWRIFRLAFLGVLE